MAKKVGRSRWKYNDVVAAAVLATACVAFLGVWLGRGASTPTPKGNGDAESQAPGVRRAVLVGVDDYAVFPDLKYASADVELICKRLLALGFKRENVVALTTRTGKNDAALLPNLGNVERELVKTLDATGPNDAVFFFFSGHGFQAPEFDGFAPYVGFVPFDATRKGNGGVDFASTFSLSRFFERLAKTEARFKWVVVDACREEIDPSVAATAGAATERRRGGLGGDSTALGLLAAPSGSVVLQSCDEGQFSYEDDELRHGVFTYYLAESLTEKGDTNGDGEITLLEAVTRTSTETRRAKPEQKPYFNIKATDVGLIAGIKDDANPQVAAPPEVASETANGTKTNAPAEVAPRVAEQPTPNVANDAPQARAEAIESARLYRLGRALAFGLDGRKIDQAAGFERLKEATDLGSFDAQAELAELYLNGCVGTKADPAEAFDLATDPARAGNPFAQNVLAICFRDGLSARQDEERSKVYFTDACAGFQARQNDDVRAATALGERYLNGEGVAKDEKAAARLFLEAAEADYIPAMTRLGACFANGVGVEQDFEKATKWFLKAAELNDAVAMTELGACYANGTGFAQDLEKATKWFQKAAELGNASAMMELGACYATGAGVALDLAKADEWFLKAVERASEILGERDADEILAALRAERAPEGDDASLAFGDDCFGEPEMSAPTMPPAPTAVAPSSPPDYSRVTTTAVASSRSTAPFRFRAVLVGVDKRRDENAVAADVEKMRDAALAMGGDPLDVVVLTNADASAVAIKRALASARAAAGGDDTLFVFFLGRCKHVVVDGRLRSFFLQCDADPSNCAKTGIDLDELLETTRNDDAGRKMFAFDADLLPLAARYFRAIENAERTGDKEFACFVSPFDLNAFVSSSESLYTRLFAEALREGLAEEGDDLSVEKINEFLAVKIKENDVELGANAEYFKLYPENYRFYLEDFRLLEAPPVGVCK